MKRFFVLFFIFFCSVNLIFSQHSPVRNFYSKQTGSGTQNWDIIQRKNDWMYFANNNGLLEFDGTTWSLYPIGNYTNVRSLFYDEKQDVIYAGAFNEFGYYYTNQKGLITYKSLLYLLEPADKNFSEIWHIVNVDNNLYFQGNNEIFRLKDNKIKRFNLKDKIECVNNIHNSLIIACASEGVKIMNGDIFIQLPNSAVLNNKKVCAILPFEENKILFVTDFYGIYVFDGEKVNPYKTDIDKFLSENQVFCASLKNNKLAIGTVRNGLVVKDLSDNSNVFANVNSELQNNTVLSLSFDNKHNLWLGLDKGIDYVMINSPLKELIENNRLFGSGYTSKIKDNLLYLGTNQGLYSTSFPLNVNLNQLKINLVPNMQGQVWCLQLIDNTLFCGTDHGAYIINGTQSIQLPNIDGTWNFKKLKHHPDYILGASYKGFFLLKKENNRWVFSNYVEGFDDSGGMYEEDENGYIWFAHWIKGFFKLMFNETLDKFTVEHFDTSKGFYTERNSVLFVVDDKLVFSSDGGFFEFSKETNSVVHHDKIEKLFGVLPYSLRLIQSQNGDIWNVSSKGVEVAFLQSDNTYKIKKAFYSSLNNKLIPGFQNLNFINDSVVIVSTENGFAWFDFSKMNEYTNDSLKVSINRIIFTNEPDSVYGGMIENNNDIPKFKYKHNSIHFSFSAPDYTDENSVLYSCFLENYDSDWSAFSSSHFKEYTKLPKGTYNFKVRAKKVSDDNVMETGFKFVILPPWYETNIALFIYFIFATLALFQIFIVLKKRSERALVAVKEQKEKELREQKEKFKADTLEKEKEIVELKNQKMQYELRNKARELAGSTMNLARKNEILLDINSSIGKITDDVKTNKDQTIILNRLHKIEVEIRKNIERDDNWKKFEENFDLVHENFLKRIGDKYPSLSVSDKKLCAYLKMGLRSKDIAPLLNMSYRSIEMGRYRLRKKLDLDGDENLSEFLQGF